MGFFSKFFGTGPQTSKQQQTTSAAPEAMAYYRDLLQRLKDLEKIQYTPYKGERVAGFTPYQQMAMKSIEGLQGAGMGTLQEAIEAGRRGTAPITTADIQRYQNPYETMLVDAMSQQMRQQEAEDISKLQGTSISRGAFGGDRAKMAQAQMMRDQARERNSRIAELKYKGYSDSVAAAQADREASARGSSLLSSLAQQEINQPLSYINALYGAGRGQQELEQQRLNIPYQEYLERRSYPFQKFQYLAGMGTGIGSQMGGTSSGTTTTPGTPLGSQILGAIGAGIGAFAKSDERVKENIEDVGTTHDGQTIYKYNYKGDPTTQIGLLAQEVEQAHPEAVKDISGIKYVNYDLATRDSMHKADGGGIDTPYSENTTGMFAKGFIPSVNITKGRGASGLGGMSAPSGRQDNTAQNMFDTAMSLADAMKKKTDPTNPASWQTTTTLSPENPASWATSVNPVSSVSPMSPSVIFPTYAHGGGIHAPYKHFETGGFTLPDYTTADLNEIIKRNALKDQGMPSETSGIESKLPEIDVSVDQSANKPPVGIDQPFGKGTSPETEGEGGNLFGLLPTLSPEAKQSLVVAGLGMMAGRDPNAFTNIGAGGVMGMKHYSDLMQAKQEQALKEKEIAAKANKLNIVRTDMVTEDGEDIYIDKNTGTYYVGPDKLELDPNTKKMQKKEYQLKEKQKLKDEADLNRLSNSLSLQISDNADTRGFIEALTPDIDYLTSGFLGVPLSKIPGTQAANVAEALETIKSRLGFDKLQAIRANSPTGAGLGNTTNLEIQSLQKSVRSLSISQSPEKLKENLNAIIKSINRIETEQKRQFAQRFGEDKLFETIPTTGETTDPANPRNLPTKTWADEQGKPVKGIQVDGQWMDIRDYKP